MRLLLLLLLLLLPPMSLRAQNGKSYDALFVAAGDAYDAVDLKRAVDGFRAAAAVAETDAEKVDALLWLGVSAGQSGKNDVAEQAFLDALTLDKKARLPVAVSPKVQQLFDKTRASLPVDEEKPPPKKPEEKKPEEEKKQQATPAPAAPSSSSSSSPLPPVLAASGGVAVVIGAALGAFAAVDIATAADPTTAQQQAQLALDRGNFTLACAAVAAAAGVVVGGAGVALLLTE